VNHVADVDTRGADELQVVETEFRLVASVGERCDDWWRWITGWLRWRWMRGSKKVRIGGAADGTSHTKRARDDVT